MKNKAPEGLIFIPVVDIPAVSRYTGAEVRTMICSQSMSSIIKKAPWMIRS